MVRAEHVDHPVVAALELVAVVGDVRQPVGGLAAALDDHPVLRLAELGGPEPGGALLLVDQAAAAQRLDHLVHPAILVEGVLVEVGVKGDADALEGGVDVGEDRLLGPLLEHAQVGVTEAVAALIDQGPGDIADVVTLVAVLGELERQAEQFQVARPGRLAKHAHLPAGVVEVVFALHLVAAGNEQAGDGVAQHRVAAVAHAQGAGGVGADKLDQHPLAGTQLGTAELLVFGPDRGQHRGPDVPGEEQVDEAGPGDLHPGEDRVGGEQVGKRRGQVTGVAPVGFGRDHGKVGGEVALFLALGHLHGVAALGLTAPQPLLRAFGEAAVDCLFNACFDHEFVTWQKKSGIPQGRRQAAVGVFSRPSPGG